MRVVDLLSFPLVVATVGEHAAWRKMVSRQACDIESGSGECKNQITSNLIAPSLDPQASTRPKSCGAQPTLHKRKQI
jgi:hypothetical protein